MTDISERLQRMEDLLHVQRAVIEATVKALVDGESFEYLDQNILPRLLAALKLSRMKQ